MSIVLTFIRLGDIIQKKSDDKDSSSFPIFREVAFGASHYEDDCEYHF